VQCDCGVIRGGGGASGGACGAGDAPNATQLQDYVESELISHAGMGAPGCVAVAVPPECLNAADCARGPDLSDFPLSFDFNYMRPTVDGCSHMVTRRGNRDEVSRMVSRCLSVFFSSLQAWDSVSTFARLLSGNRHSRLAPPPVGSPSHGGALLCLGAGCLRARILDMRLRRRLRADV